MERDRSVAAGSGPPRRTAGTLAGVAGLERLIAIADEPTDDDDLRLRKRVGVVAGYIIVLAALRFPSLPGPAAELGGGVALPPSTPSTCCVLARTKRFDRYVTVLAVSMLLVSVVVEVALGGLDGSSAAIVFAFLAPVSRAARARAAARHGLVRRLPRRHGAA